MADELDPQLETQLRAVLHHEADSLPFLITTDDIERARRRRGGRRLALPASLLGVAAVLAILVASGVIGRGNEGDVAAPPSASATAIPLATYEELDSLLGVQPADVLRDEHPDAGPGGEPVTRTLGTIHDGGARYGVHCLGGSIDLVATVDGSELGTTRIDCNVAPFEGTAAFSPFGAAPAGPVSLSVTSAPGVRWRIVVSTIPVERSPSPTPFVLASYEELEARLAESSIMPVILRGEHPVAGTTGTDPIKTDLGPVGSVAFEDFAYSCTGGSIRIDKVSGDTVLTGFGTQCSDNPEIFTDGTGSVDPAAHIVVTASPQVVWRLVATGVPTPSQEPTQPAPSASPSLAPVAAGATPLVTLDITALDGTVTRDATTPTGTDKYLLHASCSGSGTLDLSIDNVQETRDCGAIGTEVFAPSGAGNGVEVVAAVTGEARFLLRLDAVDLAATPPTWQPPTLTLRGPDVLTGGLGSTQGFPGCGLVFQPKGGGGFADDCGPSWQPVPDHLVQKPGTTVSISLPAGWTMTRVDGAIARNNAIQLTGRAPAEQAWTGAATGDTWTFPVPPLGFWGVRLTVSATKDGDTFQVPYYAAVYVMP